MRLAIQCFVLHSLKHPPLLHKSTSASKTDTSLLRNAYQLSSACLKRSASTCSPHPVPVVKARPACTTHSPRGTSSRTQYASYPAPPHRRHRSARPAGPRLGSPPRQHRRPTPPLRRRPLFTDRIHLHPPGTSATRYLATWATPTGLLRASSGPGSARPACQYPRMPSIVCHPLGPGIQKKLDVCLAPPDIGPESLDNQISRANLTITLPPYKTAPLPLAPSPA